MCRLPDAFGKNAKKAASNFGAGLKFTTLRAWCHALQASVRMHRESAASPMVRGAGRACDVRHLAVCPLLRVVGMQLLGDIGVW